MKLSNYFCLHRNLYACNILYNLISSLIASISLVQLLIFSTSAFPKYFKSVCVKPFIQFQTYPSYNVNKTRYC